MPRAIKKNKKMNKIGSTFTNTYTAAIAGLNEEEAREKLTDMISESSKENSTKLMLATGRLTTKIRKTQQHNQQQMNSGNAFDILSNEGMDESGDEISDNEGDDEQDNNFNINNTNVSNNNIDNKKIQKSKLPPIVVYNANIKKTIDDLKLKLKHGNFNIKSMNKNCTHINTQNIQDFDIVSEYIKNKELNHFTYTPPERKTINLLIKGINSSFTPQEIVDEINEIKLDNVNITKCAPFKNRNNPDSNIFLLTLTNTSDIKQLVNIKYLLHQKIYFDKIRKSDGIIMCHRCQKIGHSAVNCSMQPRCVKCSENHLTNECNNVKKILEKKVDPLSGEIITTTITVPKCVNCGQEGHPANYSKCPARLSYINKLNEKKEINRKITQNRNNFIKNSINNYVKPNLSYAQQLHNQQIPQIVSQMNTTQNNIKSPNFSFFEKECEDKLGDNLFNIIEKVDEFVPYYKTLPEHKKKIALLTFIMSLC